MQQTRSTHTLVHFVASCSACTRGAGPHVYCLVWKLESDEEVLQACAAIVVADALLEKPKIKKKKWVNDYFLKRTTKGSYGGLLTEQSLEKEIFKEYLRMIQSIPVSSEILCIQYFCIHHRYCILQRYRVSQPAVVIQSISLYDAMRARTSSSSIPSLPHQTTSHHDCSCYTAEDLRIFRSSTARGDIRTRQIRAFFSFAASVCNFE